MEAPTVKLLRERLKSLRTLRGLTQEQFAEQNSISYKYYQAVEAGRKPDLRLSTLIRLAEAHGLEVWQLLAPEYDSTRSHSTAEPRARHPKKSGG